MNGLAVPKRKFPSSGRDPRRFSLRPVLDKLQYDVEDRVNGSRGEVGALARFMSDNYDISLDTAWARANRWVHKWFGWVGPYEADALAVGFGLHPSELWPEWWDEALDERPVEKCRMGHDLTPENRVRNRRGGESCALCLPNHPLSIPTDMVAQVVFLRQCGLTCSLIARRTGVSRSSVHRMGRAKQ